MRKKIFLNPTLSAKEITEAIQKLIPVGIKPRKHIEEGAKDPKLEVLANRITEKMVNNLNRNTKKTYESE